jgi:hypothetical protein
MRPISGKEGDFIRTSHSRDFAIDPPYPINLIAIRWLTVVIFG